jgi:hypothetical protein
VRRGSQPITIEEKGKPAKGYTLAPIPSGRVTDRTEKDLTHSFGIREDMLSGVNSPSSAGSVETPDVEIEIAGRVANGSLCKPCCRMVLSTPLKY